VIEVNEGISLPQTAVKVFPGDDLPGFLQKQCQHLKRLFRKLDAETVLSQLARREVNFEHTEPQDPGGNDGGPHNGGKYIPVWNRGQK
jgi:hypothetical protein